MPIEANKEKMDFSFKIREEIEGLRLKDATLNQIAMRLGFEEGYEREALAKILRGMCADGALLEVAKGKYSIPARENVIKGVLRGNRRGFGFLIREDGGEDLFIPHKGMNGAMHGDTVFARLVKGDEAKVISVIERGASEIVGTFRKEGAYGFVVPDDKGYFCDLFIPPKKSDAAPDNSKVVARITGYAVGKNPEAEILEVIGQAGEKHSEVISILKAYGFFEEFPKEVEQLAESIKYFSVNQYRKDLRNLLTVTIDGEDSKDLDDAVSLLKEGDKSILYVHIADVSHYVETGSIIDKEAIKRATSVYFPGSVFPMLPKALSNGICSLNQNEDRLTLSVKITLNAAGDVIDSEIMESIIRNDRRMTYKGVSAIFRGDEQEREKNKDVAPMLFDMLELSKKLIKKRSQRGAVEFDTKESKIILNDEGSIEKIVPYEYTEANALIEEFMVLANRTVAQFADNMELPFVYRVHEKPDVDKMKDFNVFIKGCGLGGFQGKIEKSKQLQTIMEEVKGTPLQSIVGKVMLRSMQKAKYTTECLGHFGLALEYYCHFTSPIRRYPDLMVHRALKMVLEGKMDGESKQRFMRQCEEASVISSEREKASERAERDIDDYYKAEYMAKLVGKEFSGVISGVTSFGTFVELDNTCEGLVRIKDLPSDKYEFIEKRYQLKGTKHSYSLGQIVKIKVLAADAETKRVDFKMLEE